MGLRLALPAPLRPGGGPGLVLQPPSPPAADPGRREEPEQVEVAELLEQLERLDRGHTRHRALNIGGGGAMRHALEAHFSRAEQMALVGEEHALAFPDESFDLVLCSELLPGADRPRTIREMLRVMRLLGAGVLELPGFAVGRSALLSVAISVPDDLMLRPGQQTQIPCTLSNLGWSAVSGAGVDDLRLVARVPGRGGHPEPAGELRLPGVLLPGQVLQVDLVVSIPDTARGPALDLSLQCTGPEGRVARSAPVAVSLRGPRGLRVAGGRHPSGAADEGDAVTAEVTAAGGLVLEVRAAGHGGAGGGWLRYVIVRG